MPICGAVPVDRRRRPARGEHPRLAAAVAVDRTGGAGRGAVRARSSRAFCGRWSPFAGGLLRLLGLRRFGLPQRQVVRRPVRNALTIGVVYVAMSIGIGLGSIITTTVGDVRTWYRQTLQGDFFLRTAFPNNRPASRSWCPTLWKQKSAASPA